MQDTEYTKVSVNEEDPGNIDTATSIYHTAFNSEQTIVMMEETGLDVKVSIMPTPQSTPASSEICKNVDTGAADDAVFPEPAIVPRARKPWTMEQQLKRDSLIVTERIYTEDGTQLFGLDAEHEIKMRESNCKESEVRIIKWLELVTDMKIVEDSMKSTDGWRTGLETGEVLCALVNIIQPGLVSGTNAPTSPIAKLENLRAFQAACQKLCVPSDATLHVGDLHKGKNLRDVLVALENFAKFCDSRDDIEVQRFQARPKRTFVRSKNWKAVDTVPRRRHVDSISLSEPLPINHGSFKRKNGRVVYGMDAEQCEREAERRVQNVEEEKKLWQWLESVADIKLTADDPMDDIQSGTIMCKLANTLWPGSCPRISSGTNPLAHMDNMNVYLAACVANGLTPGLCFNPSDIEESRFNGVLSHISSVARHMALTPSFNGPYLDAAHEELARTTKANAAISPSKMISNKCSILFSRTMSMCAMGLLYLVISPIYLPWKLIAWNVARWKTIPPPLPRKTIGRNKDSASTKTNYLDQPQSASYGSTKFERDENGRWRPKARGGGP
eukprot:CFRG5195T1